MKSLTLSLVALLALVNVAQAGPKATEETAVIVAEGEVDADADANKDKKTETTTTTEEKTTTEQK